MGPRALTAEVPPPIEIDTHVAIAKQRSTIPVANARAAGRHGAMGEAAFGSNHRRLHGHRGEIPTERGVAAAGIPRKAGNTPAGSVPVKPWIPAIRVRLTGPASSIDARIIPEARVFPRPFPPSRRIGVALTAKAASQELSGTTAAVAEPVQAVLILFTALRKRGQPIIRKGADRDGRGRLNDGNGWFRRPHQLIGAAAGA
jgi:hypothetical protein